MAIVRGTDGYVQVSTKLIEDTPVWVTIGVQQSWSWEETNETIDITTLGAQRARQQITTFIGFNASTEGFWDDAADAGQQIVQDASLSGEPIGLRIYPTVADNEAGPGASDKYREGNVYVNDTSATGSFDNAVQMSLGFAGTGLPQYGPPAP